MKNYSLYIDHQKLAPLIHSLEDIIEDAIQEHSYQYQLYQVRLPIYEHFILMVRTLYHERFGDVKLEGDGVKLQEVFQDSNMRKDIEVRQTGSSMFNGKEEQQLFLQREQRVKTRSSRDLQIEIKLVQWMIGSDKTIFDKRQISDKYCEIRKDRKKKLSLDKIMKILQKYQLKNMIVRDKNGEEHFLQTDANLSTTITVKRQEFSREMSRVMNNESIIQNKDAWIYFEDRSNDKDIFNEEQQFPVSSEKLEESNNGKPARSTVLVSM